jgi:hypothetical protein
MLRPVRSVMLVLFGLLASAAPSVPQSTDFEVTQVSNGIYAVIAKPGIASNGAFIVNQDDVVVVDTHLRPSWARETIAAIKKVTNKPVRYIINTHWHRDHVQGNQAYLEVWPGATIIQQELTREDQLKYQPVEIKTRAPEEIARLEKLLASGKNDKGVPLTPEGRAQLQHCSICSTPTPLRFRKSSWCPAPLRLTRLWCCTNRAATFACITTGTATAAATRSSTCQPKKSCSPGTRLNRASR